MLKKKHFSEYFENEASEKTMDREYFHDRVPLVALSLTYTDIPVLYDISLSYLAYIEGKYLKNRIEEYEKSNIKRKKSRFPRVVISHSAILSDYKSEYFSFVISLLLREYLPFEDEYTVIKRETRTLSFDKKGALIPFARAVRLVSDSGGEIVYQNPGEERVSKGRCMGKKKKTFIFTLDGITVM